MAHLTAILRLKVKASKRLWLLDDGKLSTEKSEKVDVHAQDPWKIRDNFLALRTQQELVEFLNEAGSFFAGPDSLVPEHYWGWQQLLRKMAIHGPDVLDEEFSKTTPVVPAIFRHHTNVKWARTNLKKEKGVLVLELTISGTLPAMLETIRIDHLRGMRFRTCARKDCEAPYRVDSKHARKYCTSYCAHLESVRRSRRKKRVLSKRHERK